MWLNKWHYWSENDVDFWLRHFFVLEVTTKQIPITRQSALRSWWIMTWYHSVLCSKSSYHTEWRCTSLSAGCRIEKLGEIGFCESVCELSTVKVFFIKGLIRSSITLKKKQFFFVRECCHDNSVIHNLTEHAPVCLTRSVTGWSLKPNFLLPVQPEWALSFHIDYTSEARNLFGWFHLPPCSSKSGKTSPCQLKSWKTSLALRQPIQSSIHRTLLVPHFVVLQPPKID